MIEYIVTIKIEQTIYEKWAMNLITQERIRKKIDNYETRMQLHYLVFELKEIQRKAFEEAGGDIYKAGLEVVKSLALRKWFIWGER